MKIGGRRTSLILIVFLGISLTASSAFAEKVHLEFDHYYDYPELTQALKDLAASYPEFLKLNSIGKSYQGRDIWEMTINNPKTGDEFGKPAMYIEANVHGNEVQGGEVCLYTIQFLMENYGKIPNITDLMNRRVFYILPTVNPDGRAWWFEHPNTMNSSRGIQRPWDDDNDGLYDEDGYDDIDGDGEILMMRKKVPYGNYKQDPNDPRIMVRVKPGEKGDYILLGYEGIDNDGDGRINEDPPGGYDPNRNWPGMDWQPNYVQHGSGEFPLSNPESFAVTQFLLKHPNIAGVQSFHNSGGMILRGPGSKQVKYPWDDIRVYNYIGKTGEKILPFYRYMVIFKDLYTARGSFVAFTYETLGIFSFTNELWSSKQYYDKAGQKNEPRNASAGRENRLKYDDRVDFGRYFVEWKPFHHPAYGDIELGGWRKMTNRINPPYTLPELCHRNMAFTLFHAGQMPLISISNTEIQKLGKNTYRLYVSVANDRSIPTISGQASRHHLFRPDLLTISGKNLRVISAGEVKDKWLNRIVPVEARPERIVLQNGIPGLSQRTFQWIVEGSGAAVITLDAVKGGKVKKQLLLK
ncbi:carboxypeptidase T precursor [bacterium BMS3Bbin03]|nr:carboxypeptidase T precursor [bacterium BMS3Bbin03]